MQFALREQPKETNPRWRLTPPDPIPRSIFPLFHEEPDPKLPGLSRIQQLIARTYMGHKLNVPRPSERHTGRVYRGKMTDEEAFMEAAFDLNYDIAGWLECAAHFFHVRFLRDEHNMLWTASK
jgi:hypothetical protein